MRVNKFKRSGGKTLLASPVVGTGVLMGAVADIRGENQATAPFFYWGTPSFGCGDGD